MSDSDRKKPSLSVIAERAFRPLPAFFIVTILTALALELPYLKEFVHGLSVFSYGRTSLVLHLALPLATGLFAALGTYFVFSDGALETESSPEPSHGPLSPDERGRAIQRNLPLSLITLSPGLEVTFMNPAALSLFSGEDDRGQDAFVDLIGREELSPFVDQVLDGTVSVVEEVEFRRTAGEAPRVLHIDGIPLVKNGKVLEAMFLIEDISEWKTLEEDLIESEDRYRNIFNHAACGVFFVDNDGNYLDANPAALEMLGYSKEELLKLNTRELSSDSDRRIRKLRETPGWVVEETRYLRKDGTIVDAELAGSSFMSGNETYFIGITKDISVRKKLERLLAAARSTLSALINREEDPILLCDRDGRIWEANRVASRLLGIPHEGRKDLFLIDPVAGAPLDPRQIPVDGEFSLRISTAGNRTVDCTASRLGDDCVEPFCAVAIRKKEL